MSASAATEHEPLCPDWVFSNNSNCSVAKHRGWFTSYTPFQSQLGSIIGGVGLAVVGIGTVEISVKLKSTGKGRKKHNVIKLDNVLHAPGVICNVIGGNFMRSYTMSSEGRSLVFRDQQGRPVAYFDDKKLYCLRLSGPPVGPVTGPSVFAQSEDTVYYINVRWSDSERARWEAIKNDASHASTAAGNPSQSQTTVATTPPYSAPEKAWLKLRYRGEFHFLQQHGLSIYKEADREEGRVIARALMDDDDDDYEDGCEENDHERDVAF